MGKCKKCGKYCDSAFKYCADCYEDYYEGTCEGCYKALYNDDDNDLVIVLDDNRNEHILCLSCFFKRLNLKTIKGYKKTIKIGDFLLHNSYGLLEINSLNYDNNMIIDTVSLSDNKKRQFLFDLDLMLNRTYCYIPFEHYQKFLKNNESNLNLKESNIIKKDVTLVREKHESLYRTEDGHLVRSRGELLIDNYLFNHNVRHVYEKVIIDPITDNECTCDFYLPDFDVYIEFWGLDSKKYNNTKEYKLKIYENANLKLVNLNPEDIDMRLDYVLDKIIIKFKNKE